MAGTVKKIGTSWCYIVDVGKDPTGKRIQKKKRGFKTKKEAQIALAEVIHDINKGTYVTPSKVKFKEFLLQWLDDKQTRVKESTLETYTWLTHKHIIPAFGDIELSNLTPMLIQRHYNYLNKNGILSDENIRKVHILMKDALKKAERWGLVAKNAATHVDAPKVTRKEVRVWDVDQVRTFLEVAKESPYFLIFLLTITTGMRKGEVLALPWKNVNLEDGTLSITQTLNNKGKIVPGAKTRSGFRSIDLPDETVNALREHKKDLPKQKQLAEILYHGYDLVNCTPSGKPVDRSNLTRTFRELTKKAGLPEIRFHDLRHTHATLLLKQNVHPKIVSERLGHADTRMTLDTYSHLLPSMQKETAKAFGKMLFGSN